MGLRSSGRFPGRFASVSVYRVFFTNARGCVTIGKSAPRKEGHYKISGQSQYIDDCPFPDLWHGVTVRSTIARGRINAIHFGNESPWEEICVVSAKDIPGKNIVALLETDQPFLAESRVEHAEEPILLLA